MLREDRTATFATDGTWLWRRHRFCAGRAEAPPLSTRRLEALEAAQAAQPVCVLEHEGRRWWWFRDRFFSEADDLEPEDVAALVVERERRRQRKLERAHAALAAETAPRRKPIGREVRLAVWQRDGGCCAECGSGFDLQYDHVIPHALGGADTVANLQLLCGDCNRAKGAGL
jgi:5-methylcytosine-specific restriction endonuclease McrA